MTDKKTFYYLLSDLTKLKNVGPKTAALLKKKKNKYNF